MRTVDICCLPQIKFAHIYGTNDYLNKFCEKENFIEVTYISEGFLTYEYANERIAVGKGDVICNLFDKKVKLISNGFHEHYTVGINAHWKPIPADAKGLYLPIITSKDSNTEKIRQLLDEIIKKQFLYKDSCVKGAAKILELLCEIDKCNTRKSNLPSEVLYTNRAKEYIFKNIHQPITQLDVAQNLGITPQYLCSVFKKTEGMSLMKYTNTVKLSAIKTLMEKENIHLYQAAALYGYTDANYVSRLYKKYFGNNITQ